MTGGTGNDSYYVDSKYDVVSEAVGEGTDTVLTTLVKYTLGNDVENLTYLGALKFTGIGNALDNQITGGTGADVLLGGAGNDNLNGAQGQDSLYGGAGSDLLTGGAGADFFIFKTSAESSDTITDFEHLNDRIDLHLIDSVATWAGNQAFNFIGDADFGMKAGQLRFDVASDGVHVQGDTNGDGVADFDLFLEGVTTLTSADFIL